MKKVLIIAPHFPPSNLAAVHRSRLFAQHLPTFGWEPIILMVHEKYYEEEHDYNLVKLLPKNLRLEKVKAFGITKPRLVGDIGLRAFWQLTRKAIQLIKKEKINFLYIPIPSFYAAIIGRIANARTGVAYGIDYIDPWVHTFPGSEKVFSRHWWSTGIARFLEPIAVRNASVITGVAEGYYDGVINRNPHLKNQAQFAAMPYGGEEEDHKKVATMQLLPYLFQQKENKVQLVYAGAMLPKAFNPLEQIFKSISKNQEVFNDLEIHFIGTGKNTSSHNGYNIKPIAEKYGLWHQQVYEYPVRIPYFDVLIHLNKSDGVFILGSTEPHYTPSKIYQGVLSGKPIWAILHKESTGCAVIRKTAAGIVLNFNGQKDVTKIGEDLPQSFQSFLSFLKNFNAANINKQEFTQYSAKDVTKVLADTLNKASH